MNTTKSPERKLGYWTAVIEHRTHRARREIFAGTELGRREWRLLASLTEAPKTVAELRDTLPPRRRGGTESEDATRVGRHEGRIPGHRRHGRLDGYTDEGRPGAHREGEHPGRQRRGLEEVLAEIAEKGLVTEDAEGRYALTVSGRKQHDALHTKMTELRARAGEGIAQDDFATTLRTLETMARNLGWEK